MTTKSLIILFQNGKKLFNEMTKRKKWSDYEFGIKLQIWIKKKEEKNMPNKNNFDHKSVYDQTITIMTIYNLQRMISDDYKWLQWLGWSWQKKEKKNDNLNLKMNRIRDSWEQQDEWKRNLIDLILR